MISVIVLNRAVVALPFTKPLLVEPAKSVVAPVEVTVYIPLEEAT